MKLAVISLMLLLPFRIFAQRVSGVVVNAATKLPVAEALITFPGSAQYTDNNGRFIITSRHIGDTAVVSHDGYRSLKLKLTGSSFDTIKLQPLSVVLKEVTVKAMRNYEVDSINNRKAFSSVFNYHGKGLSDMMIPRANLKYIPYNYIDVPNNTTAIASVNLLQVASLFSSKKQNTTHLQKQLIRNEEYDYVEHLFNRQRITALIPLKGDSLEQFMERYRPSYKEIKKLNNYQLNTYIKTSYNNFRDPVKR